MAMGEKYKITGQMLDKIVSMRNDQTKNYTYKEVKTALKESFNCDLSINSIRLAYLKNQNRVINKVETVQHKTVIEQPKQTKVLENVEAEKTSLSENGLRAKIVTDNEKNSLLDELKDFN